MNELKPWILGGVVVAVLSVLGAFGLVETEVVHPPAESPVAESRCPGEWLYQPQEEIDHVLIQHRCTQTDSPWIVYLAPNSDLCQYGRNTQDADLTKTVECTSIPEWPQ